MRRSPVAGSQQILIADHFEWIHFDRLEHNLVLVLHLDFLAGTDQRRCAQELAFVEVFVGLGVDRVVLGGDLQHLYWRF